MTFKAHLKVGWQPKYYIKCYIPKFLSYSEVYESARGKWQLLVRAENRWDGVQIGRVKKDKGSQLKTMLVFVSKSFMISKYIKICSRQYWLQIHAERNEKCIQGQGQIEGQSHFFYKNLMFYLKFSFIILTNSTADTLWRYDIKQQPIGCSYLKINLK